MGDEQNHEVQPIQVSPVVGGARSAAQQRKIWYVVITVVVAVILVAGGVLIYRSHKHRQRAHEQVMAQQKALKDSIKDVNAIGDLDKVKADANNLINGTQDGTYNVSNKELAQAHMARGDAELNGKDYKAAVADYDQAVKLDASLQTMVGYSQFVARYHLGERGSLIPLLETLSKPLKDSHESGSQQQLAQYETYIADLQSGKELEL
jgi:tetratricopeptide (TPR) repeat protein